MKDTISSKDGQPSSKTNGKAKPREQAKSPALRVHIGSKKTVAVNPTTFDAADWETLRERCEQADRQVVMEVISLHAWPDEARYSMLSLARDLGSQCRLKIRGKTYGDPFEAVLATMKGPKSIDAHRRSFHAAVEAAALFSSDMPETAAKQINARLAEVGAAREHHLRLVKQIRNVIGTAKPVDAQAGAQGFLAHLAKFIEADDDQRTLSYYQNEFYTWTGNAWKCQDDQNFAAQVMAFLQSMKVPKLTERFSKDVVAHLRALTNLRCWDEPMPFLVVKEEPLKIERPRLIVFQNGMIDMDDVIAGKTPKIKPVDGAYFNETVLPYNFDPKAKCPLWLSTLKDILPKTDKGDCRQLVLQEFFGYTLVSDCHLNKMLVLHGDGGNGRSTITEPWEAMLGSENVSDVPLESLGTEYRLWSLKGKLANFSGELQYMNKMHEGMVKRIVSGEVIDANRKHKDPAKFRPTAKLVVNTNDMPQVQDPTEAMWDRLIPIPFEVRIRDTAKDDKQRVAKLKAELPGIFNWAVQGLKRVLKQDRFTRCKKCEAFLGRHRTESDNVRLFVSECCKRNPGWATFSVTLYEFYRSYCETTGRKPVADSEFGKRVLRLKWIKDRETIGSRRWFYRDMSLSLTGQAYYDRAVNKRTCTEGICREISHMED